MAVMETARLASNHLLELQTELGRVMQRLRDLCDRTNQERQERLFLDA